MAILDWARGISTSILRTIFHWRFSSVFGAGLWFAGVGAMVSDKYVAALVFYALGGLWLFGWWLIEHPAPRRRGEQVEWTKKQKKQIGNRWLGAFALILITGLMCRWTLAIRADKDLQSLHGQLIPGRERGPDLGLCAPNDNETTLLIGSNGVKVKSFPVAVIQVHGRRRLVLDEKPNGAVGVFVEIYDHTGKVVMTFNGDNFSINPNNYFRMDRPDKSTLIVVDQYNHRSLYAKYFNPRVLQLDANLFYPDYGYVNLERLTSGICWSHDGGVIFSLD